MSNLDVLTPRPVIRFFMSGDRLWELLEQQSAVVHQGAIAFSALTVTSDDEARAAADRSEAEGERISLDIEIRKCGAVGKLLAYLAVKNS